MADDRFFNRPAPLSLKALAAIAQAELSDSRQADMIMLDVAPLSVAGREHVSFLDNIKYVEAFRQSQAGACVVHPDLASKAPQGMALLLSKRPYRSYALIAQAFYPAKPSTGQIAPSAVIDPSAHISPLVEVGPGAVIGAGAELADGVIVGPNAVIGPGVCIGIDTRIGACASLSHCRIGARVEIHPGVRIGQRGFGFAMEADGHVEVPQLGRVIIEDDVEVGANSTIDRGAGPDTVIGRGAKIDNLVMIAHNVQIGAGAVLVAQVGIAGSTRLGHHAVVAGQAGVAGHLSIGAGARIGAQAGVMRDVAAGETLQGSPAIPSREFWRQMAALKGLVKRKDR